MIFEPLFDIARVMYMFVMGQVPALDEATTVLDGSRSALEVIASGAAMLNRWIPWVELVYCIAVAGAWWFGFLTFKLLRVIVGHIPLFGGNG